MAKEILERPFTRLKINAISLSSRERLSSALPLHSSHRTCSKAFFTFFGSTQRHNVTDRLTDVVSDSCSASASASVRCSASGSASATAIAIDMVNSFWSDEKNENENENENELNKRNEMRSH